MILALLALLPFLGAPVAALMIRAGRNACAVSAGLVVTAALALLGSLTPRVLAGEVVRERFAWVPSLGLHASFFLDPLGLVLAGLVLGIGLLIVVYARFYLAKDDPMGRFYGFLLLFQGAMVGIALSNNVLLLLIFWELTSLSSFLLIGYWRHQAEARRGARMALTITGAGGLSLIGGLILLGNIAGSFELTDILQRKEAIQASPLYLPALLLILGGCFTKSAQFPFHFWLPQAMAAPTPVSAYLHSATMVKAGIFLMARLWPVLAGTDAWFYIVATTGLVTMLFGAVTALFKDDLKGLLAYSTISHLGMLTMLFGFGTPMAAVVGVFHLINHATFKAALFMNAGIVDHETGTRDLKRLGGLASIMPISATLGVLAAASMAGLPPLNGFLSKEMMLEEAAHTPWLGQAWLVPAIATLAATLSVAYALRYIVHTYFGPRRSDDLGAPHDPPFGLWAPSALLVVLVILIGLFPATVAGPLVRATSTAVIGAEPPEVALSLWHGFTPALGMSVVAVIGGSSLLAVHFRAGSLWQRLGLPEAAAGFEAVVVAAVKGSRKLTVALHNGSLQRYLAFFIGTAIVLGFAGFWGVTHEGGTRPTLPVRALTVVGWLVLLVCTGAVLVLHRSRYAPLLFMGVISMVIALGFVFLSAPDLALTQVSVDVVTILLMLLALNLLPKETPRESSVPRRVRDAVLAVLGGVGMGAAAWSVMTREHHPISDFYWKNALPKGGGTNVVNVILVDFRGFDTFGEITVLGIAALTIFALLETANRGQAGRRLSRWRPARDLSPERYPLVLVMATRLLLPLAVLTAVFVFLRGHNSPGGGFIAGLVISLAVLMQYLASGFKWADLRVRPDHHALIGWGVLVAALTGLGALVFDVPFLTSAFGHFEVPVLGELELSTAMVFDIGVSLAVVGAVMLALAQLAAASKRAKQWAAKNEEEEARASQVRLSSVTDPGGPESRTSRARFSRMTDPGGAE
ncbi:monovalent cation/H+ antiporter subunit A [Chondromyces crocatus]|uniref:monovalent cation/H+ antiporter subunit A n=1 Tax=Chondromyces crocatus TaxID=52 RepID=UPI0009E8CDB1